MKLEQDNISRLEIKTKTYGLILSDVSESTDYPESGMRPDCRCCGCELTPCGDSFEVVRYYSFGTIL